MLRSVRIEIACRKHLKFKTLVGAPELARDGKGGELPSEGIYGRVRHPRYVGVIAAYQRAIDLAGEPAPSLYVSMLGVAYALVGRRAEALDILSEIAAREYVPPHQFIFLYTALGETDSAFARGSIEPLRNVSRG